MMFAVVMICGMFGYGCGYEGYSDGKFYVGIYTPHNQYGFVVEKSEIYLDTVYTVE
jgi:hypothetical protein